MLYWLSDFPSMVISGILSSRSYTMASRPKSKVSGKHD
jgi:hypothetical protein